MNRDPHTEKIYPLAIVRGKETYESIKIHLGPLLRRLEELQDSGLAGCDVDDTAQAPGAERIGITLFLGGDMKWMLLILGLSTAQHACIYCHVHENARCNYTEPHVIERAHELSEEGRMRPSLVHFIPMERVVLDVLHLHIR